MNRILSTVMIMLLAVTAVAQDRVPLTRQEKKAIRQEQKKQNDAMLAVNTEMAVRSGQFVLKADQIRGRSGYMMHVDPTVNFVAVEGKDVYVQLASPSGIGFNGLGGITLRGRISSMDINNEGKQGYSNIVLNATGTGGNMTIVMNVNRTGETATARVTTNWGNRVEFNGRLVPWTGTGKSVYKGRETH
ncbi:MAG: DUF4251 domain-containing protein [Bacteroidales bacterium]|nr:DUF4251 domain-containing protein [Bacteroidales bacterium]MDT8374558.1 DUF4251 domain-containing protein [Bacteroidales bacterium]